MQLLEAGGAFQYSAWSKMEDSIHGYTVCGSFLLGGKGLL